MGGEGGKGGRHGREERVRAAANSRPPLLPPSSVGKIVTMDNPRNRDDMRDNIYPITSHAQVREVTYRRHDGDEKRGVLRHGAGARHQGVISRLDNRRHNKLSVRDRQGDVRV